MSAAGAALLITIAVGNVMSNPTMPQPEVRSDLAQLYQLRAAVVCGNEIQPARYKAAWHAVGRAHGYQSRGLTAAPNPVAVRRSSPWRAAAVRVHRLSKGIAGLTPDRFAVVLRLEHDDGRRLVLICTHLVSRAWTHEEPSTGVRRALWHAEVRRIRAIVRFWRGRGVPVVIAGDLNRPSPVRWAARQRILANYGLIQVSVVPPAGEHVILWGRARIPNADLHTDHAMVRGTIRLVGTTAPAS